MKKITLLLFILSFTFSYSQSIIEGFLFDKETRTSLPYASIKIISSNNFYTITNEDGKFELNNKFASDSLEIRFIGFKTEKVAVSYFKKNLTFYLTPNTINLNEVFINGTIDEKYPYKLMSSLIKKYRNSKSITKSKAYIATSSSSNNLPVEHIEGLYNAEHSLFEGLIDLNIKSGRFGQNILFPFYSLDNTEILKYFSLFNTESKILPLQPGNLNLKSIKRKYNLKIEQCKTCDSNDILLSFTPKKNNLNLFSGTFNFNKDNLVLKKIELNINDPLIPAMSSIDKNDTIELKKIELKILFNPINFNVIQYIDYNLIVNYKSATSNKEIASSSFVYFYDYNKTFENPFFVKKIYFNNDYDKILALKTSNVFWENNYQFPRSVSDEKSLKYIKNYGFLINYENSIPLEYINLVKSAVIPWDRKNRLSWNVIKETLNHVFYKNEKDNFLIEKYNFNYLVDQQIDKNGMKHYVSRTIFDRNFSFCKKEIRDINKLIYINLIFDIYEFHRQKLNPEIFKTMNFEEVKNLFKEVYKQASIEASILTKETKSGKDLINLLLWNKKIKHKLKVDNFNLISTIE